MDGIQKSVHDGLLRLAEKVKNGKYGLGDDTFAGEDDELGQSFLSDMHDEVIDYM